MALKHKTAEMATINDTKKVWDSDSENEECKYMYKINTPKGNSFCLNMRNNGFWNSDNILPPPSCAIGDVQLAY